jgi:hypothetical protein
MADDQTCEVGSTQAPLATGPYSDYGKRFSENTKIWYNNSMKTVK